MRYALEALPLLFAVWVSQAAPDGFLEREGAKQFPIGFYELPETDEGLERMAKAGANLVHCHSEEDLDRVAKFGMQAVYPMNFKGGASEAFREEVLAVRDHPALAVWEGPDEVVWMFTAYSGLYRSMGIYKDRNDWWDQTETARNYSNEQAAEIIPNMKEAVELIRELDPHQRPVWINEALESDLRFVRQYIDWIVITGCDIYPVKKDNRRVQRMGPAVERWKQAADGKPVWMVLQAFSWNEIGDPRGITDVAYPTFEESRFMAYDCIARGARGILYWGSNYLKSDPFRQSIYALTSELAKLQPFLVAPNVEGVGGELVRLEDEPAEQGVHFIARRAGEDWLIVLVNEDEIRHMGTVVSGLEELNGKTLYRLYHPEEVEIHRGELIARMQPLDIQVFATSRDWETDQLIGRDFTE